MEVFKHPTSLPYQGTCLTLGSYDGVHTAHRQILNLLADKGRARNLPVGLLTFKPHPRIFFESVGEDFGLLNTEQEQIDRLQATGQVDFLWIARFQQETADLPPEEFIRKMLVEQAKVKFLAVGEDHRFGKDRAGDFALLQRLGKAYGFQVQALDLVKSAEQKISSTRIRNCLIAGNIAEANTYLGYPYPLTGRVVKGQQLGRTIGFPTANLQPTDPWKLVPANGVYAVWARPGSQANPVPAMMNIGYRPTVNSQGRHIEVHLLDWQGDLYNQTLSVSFVERIRNEQKFNGVEELKAQLAKDKAATQRILGNS